MANWASGIGGFTQGLQSGIGTGLAVRKHRQDEKLRALITDQIGDEGIGRQGAMEMLGMDTSDSGLGDPWLFKVMDKIRNRGSSAVDPIDDPSASMVAPEDDPGVSPGKMQYANGGAIQRYGTGGSVMARGPQMQGNPQPRTGAPMGGIRFAGGGGGGGMQGMAQQAMQQRSALGAGMQQPGGLLQAARQRFQPQTAPMGGGMQGMAQQAMQQRSALGAGMQRPPIALGAPGMGGFGGGGGKPGMGGAMPQPMPQPTMPQSAAMHRPMSGGQRFAEGGMIRFAAPYAEGGSVDEEAIKRAERNRERKPGRVEGRTEEVRGADRTAKPEPKAEAPRRSALPKKKGQGGIGIDKLGGVKDTDTAWEKAKGRAKGIGKGVGIGYALGAMGEGASDSFATPTEDMYGEYKMDPSKASLPRDLGVRALGTMERVGRALIPDAMEPYLGMRMKHDPVELSQSVKDEMEGNVPATGEDEPQTAVPSGYGGAADRPPPPPDPRLIPKGPTGPPKPAAADIDFSGANPAEVPNFSTEEWVKYREMSLKQMVSKGVPINEAMEKIDQQVTGMQQRNFTNYAMQGIALLQAGDINGAQSALRAAFQYFPSGSDVKFGSQNGQLFGIGVDEKTGKPVGQPFPITPESISAVVDNFRQPGAWNTWAQDQRDFQQKMRAYEEVERPGAEALASAQLTQAQAARENAAARGQEAANAGAFGGSGGRTDRRAAYNYFTDEYMNVEGLDVGPELARGLASASMQIWEMNGGAIDPTQIVEAVTRAAAIPDPQQRAALFARLGVTDPTQNAGE